MRELITQNENRKPAKMIIHNRLFNLTGLAVFSAFLIVQCTEAPKKETPVNPPKGEPIPIPGPEADIREPAFEKIHIVGYLDGVAKTLHVLPDQRDLVLEYIGAKKAGRDSFRVSRIVEGDTLACNFGIGGVRLTREEISRKAATPSVVDSIRNGKEYFHFKIFDKAKCLNVQTEARECKTSGKYSIEFRKYPLSHCMEGDEFCIEVNSMAYYYQTFDSVNCGGKIMDSKTYWGFDCEKQ